MMLKCHRGKEGEKKGKREKRKKDEKNYITWIKLNGYNLKRYTKCCVKMTTTI